MALSMQMRPSRLALEKMIPAPSSRSSLSNKRGLERNGWSVLLSASRASSSRNKLLCTARNLTFYTSLLVVFIDEQGYDMADEIDKYDEKDVSVHFILYAEQDGRKTPAGTIRMVRDSLKVRCIPFGALRYCF